MMWIGPTVLALGVVAITVAFRTECKHMTFESAWREITLFSIGAFAVFVGAALTAWRW